MLRKSYCKVMLGTAAFATILAVGNPICTTSAKVSYSTPSNSEFKAYMDYRAITDKSSKQYALQRKGTTTDSGFRIYNGRYCIAIGTGYDAGVGTYVDVKLSTGKVLNCVVGDIKRDIDTYNGNKQCRHNNSVVEFIVDTNKLYRAMSAAGSAHSLPGFDGDVVELMRYTAEDASDLGWEAVIIDPDETNSYLVTNKYEVGEGEETLYFVEYAVATDFSTVAVNKDTYDSLTVNYSVLNL